MHTTRVAVAVAVAAAGCFSTSRYDSAHVERVVGINARYEAETRRQEQWYASSVAALDELRDSLVAMTSESPPAPIHRVDARDDILTCRSQCAARGEPGATACLRDICQPLYADALTATYAAADPTWVTDQLAESPGADLESLLALSHNQAVQRHIEDQTAAIVGLQDETRNRLELERQAEIRRSTRQRNADVAHARAEHRARVKAAARTFSAMDRPVASPADISTPPPGAETPARNTATCDEHVDHAGTD